jgi:hypothetical protein
MDELILRCGPGVNGHQTIEALLGDRVVARDEVDLASADSRGRFGALICNELPGVDRAMVDRELLAIKPIPGYEWADPMPVDLPALPTIPIDGLPDRLREWIVATAEATQTPIELAALLGLAACAGVVHRRIVIEPRPGWVEPLNLYVAVLLDPGNRKSSVFGAAFKPIRRIESELIEAARPEVAAAQSDRRILEAGVKAAEGRAKSGDADAAREARELAVQLAAMPDPALPRLLLDDATAEAVEMQLAAQGGRLIVAGAEGGLFDVMGGRYNGGAGNLDVFLKGHAGDDLRVDRVIRGSTVIDRVCLTLCYSIQPDVIRGLAGNAKFRGRGMIGRFLYALPVSPLGHRKTEPDPVPDAVVDGYENLIRDLHWLGAAEGDESITLWLSPPALEVFNEWQAEVEVWLRPDGELAALTDWAGKLVGLTARLAGVIHLAGWPGGEHPDPRFQPVGIAVIEAAVAIARWAVPHARASIGLMAGDDGAVIDADSILRWLQKREVGEVSRRDIGQQFRSRFDNDQKRLDRALEVLLDRGWLREVDDHGGRPGRPSLRFDCHPWIEHPPRVAGVL